MVYLLQTRLELHASKAVEDNVKAAKKRQKTAITGDLNPLTQALLDINKLPVTKPNKKKRSEWGNFLFEACSPAIV
jgi:hypothetical protein